MVVGLRKREKRRRCIYQWVVAVENNLLVVLVQLIGGHWNKVEDLTTEGKIVIGSSVKKKLVLGQQTKVWANLIYLVNFPSWIVTKRWVLNKKGDLVWEVQRVE